MVKKPLGYVKFILLIMMRGGNHFGMQQQNFGGMGHGSSPMHMGAFGHLMNLNDVAPQQDFSIHVKADPETKQAIQ
jgi:hypothetical protein